MPKYESLCNECGAEFEYITTISDRNNTPICCGKNTEKRIFTAPLGQVDYQPWEAYESPASGKIITSKRERMEDMKRTNTRQYEGLEQEKKEADRKNAYIDAENDKKLDATIEQAYEMLSPRKKAQLHQELGALGG